jgi:hypothetical protein
LKGRVVQGIEIAVIKGEFFLRLAVFVDGGCLELLRFVVTFRAPGDIVRVAERVDINDVSVGWGEKKVLNRLSRACQKKLLS